MRKFNKIPGKSPSGASTSLIAAMFASAAFAAPACAQDTTATGPAPTQATNDDGGIKDIVVTARRRNESLLSTPVAITALTGRELMAAGIVSLEDAVNYVPGVNFVAMATEGGRADRSFASIVLRGVVPSSSSLQTTALFIDGVPVTSAISIQSLTDPARIEVLKGPQSAYFGRQTFAGAINVVSKETTDHWTGTFNASLGSRATHDFWGELSGPITDRLGITATVRDNAKNGSYQNSALPSQNLGAQETFNATLMLEWKPADNLTFKAYGLYTKDNDGPAATGFISAYPINNPDGSVLVPDGSNCSLPGGRFICGKIPQINSISTTAINDPAVIAALGSSTGRYISPSQGTQRYGLVSRYYHGHFVADWKVSPSVTLSSLTGYDHQMYSELASIDGYNSTSIPANGFGTEPFFNYPVLIEGLSKTFSEEVRASYDHGPLKASVGGSYLYSYSAGDGGGATGSAAASYNPFNPQYSKTYGIFGNLSYDLTSRLNISLEGRWQSEQSVLLGAIGGTTVTSYATPGLYAYKQVITTDVFKNFMPRAIMQYKFAEKNMVYASYSQGVNPGQFNQLLNLPTSIVAIAQAGGANLDVLPEKMTNYEIGAKGLLLDNRLRYTLAGFLMYWHDQANQQTSLFIDPVTGLPRQEIYDTNNGRVRITGVEADVVADVTHQLNFEVNAAYIDSKVLAGSNAAVTGLTGINAAADNAFRGNQNPYTSKYSATVSATYTVPLTDTISGYIRGDFTYKSKVFIDVANLTWTPASTNTNLRIGAKTGNLTVEAYASNLFNNRVPYSGGEFYSVEPSFSHFTQFSAVTTQLRDLRTVGARMTVSF
jgi:iron complex outermembrane receptor protein